jgi:type VI secretion system protein ImpM
MSLEPGWYGKIPSLGDFASRRLRGEFISIWDSWLQRSIAASRVELRDQWLDSYLHSPMWRFALMPGVIDTSAWVGLLMASVDRVGRYFPLTLALELEPDRCPDALSATLFAQSWFADLERIALAALDADFSADDLERELTRHPYPALHEPDDQRAVDNLAQWWQDDSNVALCVDLPSIASMRETLASVATRMLAGNGAGRSLWWTEAQGSGLTQLHCLAGLPPDEYFPILLQGGHPLPVE